MTDFMGISENQVMEIDQNNQRCRIWKAFINNADFIWESVSEWVQMEKKEEIE